MNLKMFRFAFEINLPRGAQYIDILSGTALPE